MSLLPSEKSYTYFVTGPAPLAADCPVRLSGRRTPPLIDGGEAFAPPVVLPIKQVVPPTRRHRRNARMIDAAQGGPPIC